MTLEAWLQQFSTAFASNRHVLSEADKRSLLSPLPESRTPELIQFSADAKEFMTRLFFRKVENGNAFGDVRRVQQQFGSTLEQNYGLNSGPFLALARTFWTFKIEMNDLLPADSSLLLTQVLLLVENEISSVFFPTPGPMTIPVSQRKEAQIRSYRHTLQS